MSNPIFAGTAQPQKRKAGQPTKFKPEFNEQVEKLCKLGATDEDLAGFFNVDKSTITNWKKVHPEFFASIKKAKMLADMDIAESLHEKARSGDTVASIFWLKNRSAHAWRDRQENVNLNAEAANADELAELLNVLDGRARATGAAQAQEPKPGEAGGLPLADAKPLPH